jgi:hypothetical protein
MPAQGAGGTALADPTFMKTDAPTPMPRALLKGLLDELRVQVHLGAMDFKAAARPWFNKIERQARERVRQRRRRT